MAPATAAQMPRSSAIYVRISQDRDGRAPEDADAATKDKHTRLAVKRQEAACRELATKLGWRVHDVYCDNDISAWTGKVRPDYDRLCADIEAGVIQGVIAWHPDRLHRRPKDLLPYIELCKKHGVENHTVEAGYWDLSSPSGEAVAMTLATWGKYESDQKAARMRLKRFQQATAGEWRGGGARPYGFEKDGVTPRPDEVAEIVQLTEAVVTWVQPGEPGQSLRALVRDLNERKVPTATGRGRWTSATLRDMLMRARNAGISVYKGDEVGTTVWEPLVPEATWRAACVVLADSQRTTTTNGTARGGTVKWLGSGTYLCGVCEQPCLRVTGMSGGQKRPRQPRRLYRCAEGSGHVYREAYGLDRYVESLLVARIGDPRVLKKLREMPVETLDGRALQAELQALGKREDKLGRDYGGGKITERIMYSGLAEITKRRDELTAQLEHMGRRTPLDPFRKAKDAADVARIWYGPGGLDEQTRPRPGGLSLGQRRALLDMLLTVTVLPNPKRVPLQEDGTGYLDKGSIRAVPKDKP